MSLLHATWLFPAEGQGGRLMLWADTWRVAQPVTPTDMAPEHPFALSRAELRQWLEELNLLPDGALDTTASLSLPSRRQSARGRKSSDSDSWSGLPLQAGEPIPRQLEWWPWQVPGLALDAAAASAWLARLPLSGDHPDLGEDLRWWSHLHRWLLSLVARGRWLPQIEDGQARWQPLLNREDDRRRLEDLASRLPMVALSALPWREPPALGGQRLTRPRPEAARRHYQPAMVRPPATPAPVHPHPRQNRPVLRPGPTVVGRPAPASCA